MRGFLCDIKRTSKLFKNVQDQEWRHLNDVNGVTLVPLILTVKIINCWIWTGKLWWIHIEMTNFFGGKIGYITRYVAVFSVWTKLSNKWHLSIYHYNSTGESVRNFCGIYFKRWFWLKICGSHSKLPPVNLPFRRFCSLKD